jgi:hypothetical protein
MRHVQIAEFFDFAGSMGIVSAFPVAQLRATRSGTGGESGTAVGAGKNNRINDDITEKR